MRAYSPPYEQTIYGGMNDTFDDELVGKYEAMLAANCLIRTIGAVSGRPGATLVGDDTGSYKVLGHGVKRNGTKFITRVLDGAANAKVQVLSGGAWSDIGSATLLKNVDVIAGESSVNDVDYYFNGDAATAVGKYNGSAWATVAAIPRGTIGKEWKNFFFVAGVTSAKRRLYISDLGDPETYGASNYIDFPEDITAIVPYFNRLVIGMKHSIAYVDGAGLSDFVVSGKTVYVPTAFDFGIVSQESAQIVGNELWAMDQEGRIRRVFRSDNDVLFGEVLSGKIENLIKSLNRNALNKVTAAYIDGYYIFYAPLGAAAENNVGAYYDTKAIFPPNEDVSRWVKHTGWTPSHFAIYESSATPELYWGENTNDSKSYKWSGVSDNGTAIVMQWRGKRNNNGYPNRPKLYRWGKQQFAPIGDYNGYIKADLDSRGQNTIKTVNFAGTGDLLGSTFTLGTSVLGSSSRLDDTFKFVDGGDEIVAKHVQMELYASYSAAIPTWYKMTYMYKLLPYR